MWSIYEDEHRDFEQDPSDSEQKLKGSISFNLIADEPPKVDLEIEISKKKGFVYKIKQKVKDVKRNPGKLF